MFLEKDDYRGQRWGVVIAFDLIVVVAHPHTRQLLDPAQSCNPVSESAAAVRLQRFFVPVRVAPTERPPDAVWKRLFYFWKFVLAPVLGIILFCELAHHLLVTESVILIVDSHHVIETSYKRPIEGCPEPFRFVLQCIDQLAQPQSPCSATANRHGK